MTVYVDDMNATFGRMKMCHMFADSTEELLSMADKIGVQRKWIQKAGTIREHFDICLSKRARAVEMGAVEISYPGDVAELMRKRKAATQEVQPGSTSADVCDCGAVVDGVAVPAERDDLAKFIAEKARAMLQERPEQGSGLKVAAPSATLDQPDNGG
ncbi:DUF4031 domain-containing protein [Pseudomonas sp. KCJK8993]|uniref:DUF4031 domain-containing protein n=1 Tax=Pseudomonas sp. KCJK8993 TaxID=3344565 RepID=UPI0039065B83